MKGRENEVILLKEDPDIIITGNSPYAHYLDNDARPFGYFNDKFYIARTNTNHPEWSKDFEEIDDISRIGWRKKMKFPGRIWLKKKIFSLWQYPKTASEWTRLIDDLSSETKKDIRKDFSIELANAWGMKHSERKNNRIILVSKLMNKIDISGSKKLNIPQHSIDTQNLPHLKSPMQKGDQEVPMDVGSKKRVGGLTQAQRYQMFNYVENTLSFKEIIKEMF